MTPRPEPAEPDYSKAEVHIVEVLILIPVADNDGVPFSVDHDAVFEFHLVKLFKGFSQLPGEGSGGWEMEGGTPKREPWRQYMVAVDRLIGDGDKLRMAALFAKRHYRQEAIGLRYLGHFEAI